MFEALFSFHSSGATKKCQLEESLYLVEDFMIPLGNQVQVQVDGSVYAVPLSGADQTPQQIAQIKLINPDDKQLYKGQDGLFRMNNGNPAEADPNVQVQVGALEGSNVNAVDSLVQMISHGRMFDLNVKLMTTADQDDRQATQLLSLN